MGGVALDSWSTNTIQQNLENVLTQLFICILWRANQSATFYMIQQRHIEVIIIINHHPDSKDDLDYSSYNNPEGKSLE